MKPSMCSSNLERLEEIKKEIRSLLISSCNEDVTLHQLSIMYKEEIGDDIPFKDFNHASLKHFLSSMPDTAHLRYDDNGKLFVYHVESDKTKHISSLVSRQKKPACKKSRKAEYRQRLHPNYIDPLILRREMQKLSHSTNNGRFKKVDLLSEIKSASGPHCFYTIQDLNTQLNELLHILIHDDTYIKFKNGKTLRQEDGPAAFIRDSTKERLEKLAEKYKDGIWCAQLTEVYRKEYKIDLEYRDLGFYDIVEFVNALPNIFKFINPPNSSQYKVISANVSDDHWESLVGKNSVENVTTDVRHTSDAIPSQSSPTVSKRLIPNEFMNHDDTVEQMDVKNILKNSDVDVDVIVSEVCNPSLFWIILRKKRRKLVALMDALQDFYVQEDTDKYQILPIVLKPGLHVACIYSKRWHRGVVEKVKFNCVTILFYDYGTTKAYKTSDLYFLHKKFSALPAQAIPCSLLNVKPVDDNKWSKAVVEKFVNKVIERAFVAHVHSINQENNSLVVDLINTSKSVNVCISEWMVSKNLAMWGSYIFETGNIIIKRHNECLKKKERKSVKKSQNVNGITVNEDSASQTSDCISNAKKLEALKKYKKRFNLLDTKQDDSSSNSSVKLDESNTENPNDNNPKLVNDSSNVSVEKLDDSNSFVKLVANNAENHNDNNLKSVYDSSTITTEKLDNIISDSSDELDEDKTHNLNDNIKSVNDSNNVIVEKQDTSISNSSEKLDKNKSEYFNNNNFMFMTDSSNVIVEKQYNLISDSSEKLDENKTKNLNIIFKHSGDINTLNFVAERVTPPSRSNSHKEEISGALRELQKLMRKTKL